MMELLVFNKELCCGVYMNKRGLFIVNEIGLAALTLIARRFENQQKKHQQHPKQKSKRFYFALALFQLFVDVFVTQRGFEPPTVRAEI